MKYILTMILVLTGFIVSAQQVSGNVVGELNDPLPFVTVIEKGTTNGTVTDLDGSFRMNIGGDTLVFSFIGYETKEVYVPTSNITVVLSEVVSELDAIVVTARKDYRDESLVTVDKKQLTGIQTSISGVELSKKGISNVESALNKVSGVTFSDRRMNVRGLDDRYNQVTINGEPLPSNNSDKKNIDLNIIPTAFSDRVVVNKSYQSNQWSNMAGAQIDITTSDIRDEFSVGYRGTYNSQANLPNGNLSFRWGKVGKVGFFYTLNIIHESEQLSGKIGLSNLQGNMILDYDFKTSSNRITPSSGLVLSYNTDRLNVRNTTFFVSQFGRDNRETFGTHFDYSSSIETIRITPTQHILFSNQLSGEYSFDKFNVESLVTYSKVNSGERDREQYVFLYDGRYQFNNIDKLDNHLFNNTNIEDRFTTTLRSTFTNGRIKSTIGGFSQITLNTFDYTQLYYDLGVVNQLYEIVPQNFSQYVTDGNVQTFEVNNPASFVDGYTRIMGGMWSSEMSTNSADINIGLRVEQPLQIVTHQDQFTPSITQQTVNYNVELLPYLNTKFKLSDRFQIKTASSITTIRPRFREMIPVIYTEVFAGNKIQGNAELSNSLVYNGDVTFEWYPTYREVVALTFFSKKINNPIERVNVATASGRLETFQNSVSSDVFGIETEVKKSFGNVDVDYNLSLLYSNIEVGDGTNASVVVTNENRPLQGSTPVLSNLDVFYNVTDNSNVGFTYRYVGRKLTSVGVFGLDDIYQVPQNFLNLIYNVSLSNKNVSVRINNVLNTPFKTTQQNSIGETTVNEFYSGVDFSLRFSYNF